MMRLLCLLLLFHLFVLTGAQADTQKTSPPASPVVAIKVDEAYARATIPGQATSAAYFSIYNEGKEDVDLVKVKSSVGHAMIHTTEYVDGMAKMRHAGSVRIPANSQVDLKPGSTHIMLMNLPKPLKTGDELTLTLVFANLPDQDLKVQVK